MIKHPQFTINRHLLTLIHKQPFLDWLLSVDPSPPSNMSLDDLRDDNDAFLIPNDVADSTEEAVKWVEKRWRMFFEYALNEWLTDESLWPQKISLKMFREWFGVEYQSMIWDLGNAPLAAEDWDQDEDEDGPTYH